MRCALRMRAEEEEEVEEVVVAVVVVVAVWRARSERLAWPGS